MGIEFNVDFTSLWQRLSAFASQDPATMTVQLFIGGGWVIFLIVLMVGFYKIWLDGRQGQFIKKWKFVLLAIDIPKNNEQTPKAVENIFAALAGTQSAGNLIERFWEGKVQESFSFEIISLEGYIQFLVRTPVQHRDLVEAAVYAQYPDAEITEVDDYAKEYATTVRFPNDKYNLWGTEFLLVKDFPYSIRTYPEFEHSLSQSFLDPMAGLLEIMSRFGPGEQLWIQLVVTPQPPGWGEVAKKVVKELTGQVYTPPPTMSDKIFGGPMNMISSTAGMLTSAIMTPTEKKKKEEDKFSKLYNMTPGERVVMEGIQRKLSKHAFRTKFRMVYLGEKGVFNKPRGVAAVIGAIQQFNTANANGFKPGKRSKTGADYFNVKARVAKRQNRILRYYAQRNNYYGDDIENMLLNTEELATIWHFPVITVKAPMVEKIVSKKVIAPTRLPLGARDFEAHKEAPREAPIRTAPATPVAPPSVELPTEDLPEIEPKPAQSRRPEPPANLPIV